MRTLQQKMLLARESLGVSRQQLAEEVAKLTPKAPDERALRRLENELLTPPADGRLLMLVCWVLKMDPFEVLEELGFWPPPVQPKGKKAFGKLLMQRAAEMCNWTVIPAGNKLVVHMD